MVGWVDEGMMGGWMDGLTGESQLTGHLRRSVTQSPRPGLLAESHSRPGLYVCSKTLPVWWVTQYLKTTCFFPQWGCLEGPPSLKECQENSAHAQLLPTRYRCCSLMCSLWVRAAVASILFLLQKRSDIFKRKKSEVADYLWAKTADSSLIWLLLDLIINRFEVEGDKSVKDKMLGPSNLWQNEEKCPRSLEETLPNSSSSPADLLYVPPFQSESELVFSWPTLNSLTSFRTYTFPLSKNVTLLPSPPLAYLDTMQPFGLNFSLSVSTSLFWSLQPPDSWTACSLNSFNIHFLCGNYSRH